MATEATHVGTFILVAGILLAQGCVKKNDESQETDVAADIVCPQLYQDCNSLADALAFIEVPEERMEFSLRSVSRRGRLPNPQQLAFANKWFSLRRSRDVELFKALLSNAARQELDGPDTDRQMVRDHLRKIENGTFLYGEWDCRFFATFHVLTQDDLDRLAQHVTFAQTPTHSVIFYHWHKPNSMLIGTSAYLVRDGDSYRIVTETLLQGKVVPVEEKEGACRPEDVWDRLIRTGRRGLRQEPRVALRVGGRVNAG